MEAFFQKFDRNEKDNFNIDLSMITTNEFTFPPHWHDEVEIICVLEGEISVWADRREYVLKGGDIFIIGSKNIHYFINKSCIHKTIMMQFNFFYLEQLGIEIEEFKKICSLLKSIIYLDENFIEIREEIKTIMLQMSTEWREKQLGYRSAIYSSMYGMLSNLIRKIPAAYYSSNNNRLTKDQEIFEHIFEFVRNHYQEEITLSRIAKEVNFHPNYFVRYFKNNIGMTFSKYLESFRIGKARNLIHSSEDKKVINISMECGFNSVKTFNRVFKMHTGLSPTEYKKLINEKE